jgi:hypothetical protein
MKKDELIPIHVVLLLTVKTRTMKQHQELPSTSRLGEGRETCGWNLSKPMEQGRLKVPPGLQTRILLPGILTWCNERVGSHSRNCPAKSSPALHAPWQWAVAVSFLEWLHCTVSYARLGTCRGTLSSVSAL